MIKEPLWIPSASRISKSQLSGFTKELLQSYGINLRNYSELHRWSITNPAEFWSSVWSFCEVKGTLGTQEVVTGGDKFPEAKWFNDSKLNFAENLLNSKNDSIALISLLENGDRRHMTFKELFFEVEKLAAALRQQGIVKGDRVVGLMPNILETVIAMLATTSIGAIWSSCSPDFGINGVIDRFGQITPRVLFTADGYYYNGKTIDCLQKIPVIKENIESIEKVVVIPLVGLKVNANKQIVSLEEFVTSATIEPLEFEQFPFNHPLFIMFSSGTTGVPKCIVHTAGGTLLQHVKEHRLHTDLSSKDVMFYYTTCGWMMWNWLVTGLASGSSIILYDGSPFAKEGSLLLDAIDDEQITIFGTSAKFISSLQKAGVKPRLSHKLSSLNTILSTGSPLSAEGFEYVYRDFKKDVCLSSICGGTDIISCFMLGNPSLPVYKGEIQCIGLGMAVDFWDEHGKSLSGGKSITKKGELVCTKPFPSAPLGFWNDPEGIKFHNAYFDHFPNIWAHGDYGELTENEGVIIHGRSDAVLNPGGVRIGTAEIYRQVEKIDLVTDSVVIGQNWDDDIRVILFVVLRGDTVLTKSIEDEIRLTIRRDTTPRHVPARVIQVPDIPRTISGKIVELAVRNAVHGLEILNKDALANPEALEHFKDLVQLEN
ncbi:MAG: acetoacetate--CoA ligase [Candidatus Azotimanducaceae bacterium]|uniref:Acetoacetate--CoA ligase n=1 Tax=OM182 bacterium TaxID=2510334 RepID=A0A520S399_9GAMM|nr:acetoacetate--CoA ligase [Gammaproteobacteria bacterium]RZO76957.1 MAG: acetoacetate--CoA ligase [OM182 bacterium]